MDGGYSVEDEIALEISVVVEQGEGGGLGGRGGSPSEGSIPGRSRINEVPGVGSSRAAHPGDIEVHNSVLNLGDGDIPKGTLHKNSDIVEG